MMQKLENQTSLNPDICILGTNSNGKTKTARDLANFMAANQEQNVVFIPNGDLFRLVSTIFSERKQLPGQISVDDVESVLSGISDNEVDGFIQFTNGVEHLEHTLFNGNTATVYAADRTVRLGVLNKLISTQNKYRDNQYIVGAEGREPTMRGINFFLTGDSHVRAQIKQYECPELKDADLQSLPVLNRIQQDMNFRDISDFRNNRFRIPRNCFIIRRNNPYFLGDGFEEQSSIIRFMYDKLSTGDKPEGQVVYSFSPESRNLEQQGILYKRSV